MVKQIIILIFFSISTLSCVRYDYAGNNKQDPIIKSIDKKLSNRKANWVWSKMLHHGDSIIRYSAYTKNNQLVDLFLNENNGSKKTFYNLVDGQLVKVQHFPIDKNKRNIYFFEDGRFLFKRQAIVDSTDPYKFLKDINSFKIIFSLK